MTIQELMRFYEFFTSEQEARKWKRDNNITAKVEHIGRMASGSFGLQGDGLTIEVWRVRKLIPSA